MDPGVELQSEIKWQVLTNVQKRMLRLPPWTLFTSTPIRKPYREDHGGYKGITYVQDRFCSISRVPSHIQSLKGLPPS